MPHRARSTDYTAPAARPGKSSGCEVMPGRRDLAQMLSYENIPPRHQATGPCLSARCAQGRHGECQSARCTCDCPHTNRQEETDETS